MSKRIHISPGWSFHDDAGNKLNPQLFPLLNGIKQTGKLTAAVKLAGISYRHGWNLLDQATVAAAKLLGPGEPHPTFFTDLDQPGFQETFAALGFWRQVVLEKLANLFAERVLVGRVFEVHYNPPRVATRSR